MHTVSPTPLNCFNDTLRHINPISRLVDTSLLIVYDTLTHTTITLDHSSRWFVGDIAREEHTRNTQFLCLL